MRYERVQIAAALTPDRLAAWLPRLSTVYNRAQAVRTEADECAFWDRQIGDLAPLAWTAGLTWDEASAMRKRGELTEERLRTLIALTRPISTDH